MTVPITVDVNNVTNAANVGTVNFFIDHSGMH